MLEEVRAQLDEGKQQNEDISRLLTRIVEIGLRGGKSLFHPYIIDATPVSSLVDSLPALDVRIPRMG